MRSRIVSACAVALLTLTAPPLHAQDGVIADVVYGHKDGMALTYDVVRPSGAANGAGVVFMVSGGWVSRWSPPEQMAGRGMFARLGERGFTLYFLRHGSSPRFKVPDAVSDVRLGVAHIRRNAEDLGVDPSRLGLVGMSAGGHLSLTVGLRAEGATGEPTDASNERANQVAAIVAYFPPVDLRDRNGPSDRFPALDFDDELTIGTSPILFATADDPPTLLLHGDEDQLVPLRDSEIMYAALQDAGVETDFVVFEGAGHGFRGEAADRSTALTVEWFERHLLHGPGR